jgi:acetyl esterase/lipase
LQADGIAPDFQSLDGNDQKHFQYIHYVIGGADVYFVCNQTDIARPAHLAFRVTGRQPEFWNPASGCIRNASRYTIDDDMTTVPMFFEPHGSMFVVFRDSTDGSRNDGPNFPIWQQVQTVSGPWDVSFDPQWGGPKRPVRFEQLSSWLDHSDPAVRHYSGKATYRTTFMIDAHESGAPLAIELSDIRDVGIARLTLNDTDLGVVWLPPFRFEIGTAVKTGMNKLEVTVVSSWHNRVLADSSLPEKERFTRTNIQVQKKDKFRWEFEDSGLLGPVRIVRPTSKENRSFSASRSDSKQASSNVAATAPVYDPSVPPPTQSSVRYGEHRRHVLDFWKADSNAPTPLVFVIHGGGWKGGSKERLHRFVDTSALLEAGISVAAINYRLMGDAEGVAPPVKAPMHDAARALQFLRSKAGEWNIDKVRIAAAGGSAGACTGLWLAYHDDLADAKSHDPVARESTRLYCVALMGPQTTLDPQQMKEWTPNSTYGGHAFGKSSFALFLADRDSILPWIAEYSPYALLSADDPPACLFYNSAPAVGKNQSDPTHTANFGVRLNERCKQVGVECKVVYPDAADVKYTNPTDYLIATLLATAIEE